LSFAWLKVAWQEAAHCIPYWGRKAIISRDRQRGFRGCGILANRARSLDLRWGNQEGPLFLALPPSISSNCSSAPWVRQEEHSGASLPTLQPRALPGLPSGCPYLPLDPRPAWLLYRVGAGIVPFSAWGRRCQPRLLHISHRDSIGPLDLGWGECISGTHWCQDL
jgi:hypothetical protein